MHLFEKYISKINEAMLWFCGAVLTFMAFLITIDIITRTLFSFPIQWSFELSGWLSATIALIGGGYAMLKGSHVKVDLIYNRFSVRTRATLDVFTSLLFFLLCVVLIWMGAVTAFETLASGATSGGGLNTPMFIPQLLIPIGGLLIGLQGLIVFVHNFKAAFLKKQQKGEK